ncbi:MAG: hypothetical protein QGH40_16955 [bacterium]|jgi:hypothetical protein|nr:hypothetical protein [bacterium]
MQMPHGELKENVLEVKFSSADFSVANVIAAVRERADMLVEMGVHFLGVNTEVHTGPSPVFRPVPIVAVFEYQGSGKVNDILERAYRVVWDGILQTFPSETEWALSKQSYADYIRAQADLLRARLESHKQD